MNWSASITLTRETYLAGCPQIRRAQPLLERQDGLCQAERRGVRLHRRAREQQGDSHYARLLGLADEVVKGVGNGGVRTRSAFLLCFSCRSMLQLKLQTCISDMCARWAGSLRAESDANGNGTLADWLHNEWEGLNATLSSPTLATEWLQQMGAGAAKVGVPIQYCMAYGRHTVASAGVPAVNQVRRSRGGRPY